MSSYLLNLIFTVPSSGPTNGMFDPDAPSQQWYSFNPLWEEPSYGSQVTGLDNPVLVSGAKPVGMGPSLECSPNDDIYIQVLPSAVSVSPTSCTLGIAFGRASGPVIAAPFHVSDSDTNPCTYFPYSSMPSSGGSGSSFWVCYLGPAVNLGSFDFIVDVSVPGTSGSQVYFGLDPQMDVTPGVVSPRDGGAKWIEREGLSTSAHFTR